MQKISEQQILSWAPNTTAASNGKKISRSGGLVRLERSEDDTFYLGECKGSGKSNYITSVDFIEPSAPVCRCSCPSRQFPCKHSLALLYEIMENKTFGICEIPEDILKKRAKKLAKEEKVSEENLETSDISKAEEKSTKKKTVSKSARSAKEKKIKKQLEGLDLLEKMVQNLLQMGLGTMGGNSLNTYRQLSKQLGDYYLPGPQRLLNGLILEIEAFQRDGKESHYENAIDILKRMWNLVKKSREYLKERLESETLELDANLLYEELGGIWKLSELEALGRSKENVNLVQLSFWVTYDETRKEFIDTGCWIDLDSGEIYMTYNYRPIKALKYVKEEDSVFEKLQISKLMKYPGEGNVRVRWDGAEFLQVSDEDFQKIRLFASSSLKNEGKNAKNLLKNPLSPSMWIRLLAYDKIGMVNDAVVLRTAENDTIMLGDCEGMEPTVERLVCLPDCRLLEHQVLAGGFFYDSITKRLMMQPLAIVTERSIVRLLY